MMTGYTTDKVSPSDNLNLHPPKTFRISVPTLFVCVPPTNRCCRFVMLPRPLQESNVVGKGGTAGFLGKAYDPYTLFPEGDDMDMKKMDKIQVSDLQLRPEVFSVRLERRAALRDLINQQMPTINAAVENQQLDTYFTQALSLITSGGLVKLSIFPGNRKSCAMLTVATRSGRVVCWPDDWSKPERESWK